MDSMDYTSNIILAILAVILGMIIQTNLPLEVRGTVILLILFILFLILFLTRKIEKLIESIERNVHVEYLSSRKKIYQKAIEMINDSESEVLIIGGPKPWDDEYIKIFRKRVEKNKVNFVRVMNCFVDKTYFEWAKEEISIYAEYENYSLIHNPSIGIRQIVLWVIDGEKAIIAYPTRIKRSIDKGIYTKDENVVDSLEDLFHNFYEDGIKITDLDHLKKLYHESKSP